MRGEAGMGIPEMSVKMKASFDDKTSLRSYGTISELSNRQRDGGLPETSLG